MEKPQGSIPVDPLKHNDLNRRLSSWKTIKSKLKTSSAKNKNKAFASMSRSRTLKRMSTYNPLSSPSRDQEEHVSSISFDTKDIPTIVTEKSSPRKLAITINDSKTPFASEPTANSSNSVISSGNSMSHESMNSQSSTLTSSEKKSNSTTGVSRSLSKMKRRTRSLLLLDYSSTLVNSHENITVKKRLSTRSTRSTAPSTPSTMNHGTPEQTSKGYNTPLTSDGDNSLVVDKRPQYKKSLSYNSLYATKKEEGAIPLPKNNIQKEEELESAVRTHSSSYGITRQRSKTVGALDLRDESKNEISPADSGVFTSITNFVKIRKQTNDDVTSSRLPSENTSNLLSISMPDSALQPEKIKIQDDETPMQFLERLLDILPISQVCCALSARGDDKTKASFKEYLNRYFNFTGESIDIALRKFLMINELPKETLHIDRIIYKFASHYHENNSMMGASVDLCYIVTYSLIMIHTDRFNPNNKRKMTKMDFINNLISALKADGSDIKLFSKAAFSKEVMEYLYDNITYTPFAKCSIEASDEIKKSFKDVTIPLPYPNATVITNNASTPVTRKRSGTFLWNSLPLDPYEYILENKLSKLKPDVPYVLQNPFINIADMTGDRYNGLDDELILLGGSKEVTKEWISKNVESNIEAINANLFSTIRSKLTDPNCSMILKVQKSKGEFLLTSKTDVVRYDVDDDCKDAPEFLIARVFEIGMVSRQESKLLTGTKLWKKYFCILTSTGILFYKNLNSFKMNYIGISGGKNVVVLEENLGSKVTTSPGVLLDSFEPNFTIPINGAFASRMKKNVELDEEILQSEETLAYSSMVHATQHISPNTNGNYLVLPNSSRRSSIAPVNPNTSLRSCTFFIYGKDSKDIYKVDNKYELKSWINSINYLSALDNCKLRSNNDSNLAYVRALIEKGGPARFSEVFCLQQLNTEDKLVKLHLSIVTATDNLLQLIFFTRVLKTLAPFSVKTRDLIASVTKLTNVKVQWMWFEIQRNATMVEILKQELKVGKLLEDDHKINQTLKVIGNESHDKQNIESDDSDVISNCSRSSKRTSDTDRYSSSDIDEFVSAFDVSIYDS